jgi:hypothetical protein
VTVQALIRLTFFPNEICFYREVLSSAFQRKKFVVLLTNLGSVAAVNVVQVVAVFGQVLGVACVESETIAASLELGLCVLALVIFVTGLAVWVETVVIWALEALLSGS